MKNKFILLGLIISLVFSSCKTAEDVPDLPKGYFIIEYSSAEAIFYAKPNGTFLVFRVKVTSHNEIAGTLKGWKFVMKSGDNAILEINSENYSAYFLTVLTADNDPSSINPSRIVMDNPLHIQATSFDREAGVDHLYPGNLFALQVPDRFETFLTIQDDNGSLQTIKDTNPFHFRIP